MTVEPKAEELKGPPTVELKPQPSTLRHEYLGENFTYPVIFNANLVPFETEKIIRVLTTFQSVIWYTIDDIKGIDPSFFTHQIFLEDDCKPSI